MNKLLQFNEKILNDLPIKIQKDSCITLSTNSKSGDSVRSFIKSFAEVNSDNFNILVITSDELSIKTSKSITIVENSKKDVLNAKNVLNNVNNFDYDCVIVCNQFNENSREWVEQIYIPNIKVPHIFCSFGSGPYSVLYGHNEHAMRVSFSSNSTVVTNSKFICIREKNESLFKIIKICTFEECGFDNDYFNELNSKLKTVKVEPKKSVLSIPQHFYAINLYFQNIVNYCKFRLVYTIGDAKGVMIFIDGQSGRRLNELQNILPIYKDILDDVKTIESEEFKHLFYDIEQFYLNGKK